MSDTTFAKSGVAYATLFWLKDVTTGAGITGEAANFAKKLTASGVNSAVTVTVSEVDNTNEPGLYKAAYTPNATGIWDLLVTHATYNPWGWQDTIISLTQATNDDGVAPTNAFVDAILDRVAADTYTFRQFLRLLGALAGKSSGSGANAPVLRAADDSKARITATIDGNGDRSAVTLDLT